MYPRSYLLLNLLFRRAVPSSCPTNHNEQESRQTILTRFLPYYRSHSTYCKPPCSTQPDTTTDVKLGFPSYEKETTTSPNKRAAAEIARDMPPKKDQLELQALSFPSWR